MVRDTVRVRVTWVSRLVVAISRTIPCNDHEWRLSEWRILRNGGPEPIFLAIYPRLRNLFFSWRAAFLSYAIVESDSGACVARLSGGVPSASSQDSLCNCPPSCTWLLVVEAVWRQSILEIDPRSTAAP